MRAVGARAAIISVGRNNLFGHPAAVTLATLDDSRTRVYRTDRDGAVVLRTDGTSFWITPFLSPDSTLLSRANLAEESTEIEREARQHVVRQYFWRPQ